jgi:chorismate mutase
MPIYCRGIRGATTVETNTREEILRATRELLQQIIEANDLQVEDVGSAIFTTTPDLNAEFPAVAARQLGWHDVPLMCGHEMTVPGALDQCLRVLIHWNTPKLQKEIVHVYTRRCQSSPRPAPGVARTVRPHT